jgi:cell division protein ZapA (FtsZ GTPase activity inhibitor)
MAAWPPDNEARSMPQDSGTQVNIFGQVFHIKGGNDTEQTRQLAELVDQKMNFIASQVRAPDNYRVAVLTALHLADEYTNLKQENERLKAEVSVKAGRINSLLDQAESDLGTGSK